MNYLLNLCLFSLLFFGKHVIATSAVHFLDDSIQSHLNSINYNSNKDDKYNQDYKWADNNDYNEECLEEDDDYDCECENEENGFFSSSSTGMSFSSTGVSSSSTGVQISCTPTCVLFITPGQVFTLNQTSIVYALGGGGTGGLPSYSIIDPQNSVARSGAGGGAGGLGNSTCLPTGTQIRVVSIGAGGGTILPTGLMSPIINGGATIFNYNGNVVTGLGGSAATGKIGGIAGPGNTAFANAGNGGSGGLSDNNGVVSFTPSNGNSNENVCSSTITQGGMVGNTTLPDSLGGGGGGASIISNGGDGGNSMPITDGMNGGIGSGGGGGSVVVNPGGGGALLSQFGTGGGGAVIVKQFPCGCS